MSNTTIVEQATSSSPGVYISSVVTDGRFKKQLSEHMALTWNATNINNVFLNATRALLKFVSPASPEERMTKLLCLGKVQSGKTAFFISSIAMAFDNGYDIAYVIGGTKNNLLSQNTDRILEELGDCEDILIMDLNNANADEIRVQTSSGCKVILMVLKHKTQNSETNLANLEKLSAQLSDIPSVIVDDEGDERSPGDKKNKGKASNAILNAVKSIKRGTYMSVTATPQANLLLTRLESLAPDDCVLVEPGIGYTGASVFHDTLDNPLITEVMDVNDFDDGVPDSFKEALYWFVLGCAVRYLRGDSGFHSMLVHPSSRTSIQSNVFNRIKAQLNILRDNICNPTSMGYDTICEELQEVYNKYRTDSDRFPAFSSVLNQIKKNMNRTDVYQINTREGSADQEDIGRDKYYKYKIYVGGNMLERGITVKNLAVTYIYRTAKKNPVDNTLQRARWFGYKQSYLDLCRVYMTPEMKQQFVDITNHENFLWETVARYLKTGKPFRQMERIFRLDNDQLILTRTSVAKTIKVGSLTPGYAYDKSIDYASEDDVACNLDLLERFIESIDSYPEYIYYGKSNEHKHKLFRGVSFAKFFEEVVSNYRFPRVCPKINLKAFEAIYHSVQEGLLPDSFSLVRMRDGENQYRSTIVDGRAIKELPESYQTTNGYVGDKRVLEGEFFIQIHYVYTNKDAPTSLIPFIALNNPSDNVKIRYVTGEFNV